MSADTEKRAAIKAVLDYVSDPMKRKPLASAEDCGVGGELLIDLYLSGYLWAANRDGAAVFGVTPMGRRFLYADSPTKEERS